MKGLQTLIKLHKTKIDAIIVDINKLENIKSALEQELALLVNTINQELKLYQNTEYSFFLESFLKLSRQKKEDFSKELLALANRINAKREELIIEFSELKKIEILLNNRLKAQKEALSKKEEIVLNDNVLMKYNYDKKS
ncbi:MAG: hypothetical protein K0R02_1100 [Rickettsiaceae bacterium]|jgi:hypothetical protein|nr:hypothetical protein [Rickettsiaceae bacterium]